MQDLKESPSALPECQRPTGHHWIHTQHRSGPSTKFLHLSKEGGYKT
jgi:hypothetical protein